jgi:hypothetical protein
MERPPVDQVGMPTAQDSTAYPLAFSVAMEIFLSQNAASSPSSNIRAITQPTALVR